MIKKLIQKYLSPAVLIAVITVAVSYHFGTITDIRGDYEAKLDVITREKEDAITNRDKYYNHLLSIPGSYDTLELKIQMLNEENTALLSKITEQETDKETTEQDYEKDYYIKKNTAIHDTRTDITIGLLTVTNGTTTTAVLNISDLNNKSSQKTVKVGDIFYLDPKHKILIEEINWYSDSIDIRIYTPKVIGKAVIVKKKFWFDDE